MLSLQELVTKRRALEAQAKEVTREISAIDAALSLQLEGPTKARLAERGKVCGEVTITVDGLKFKAAVRRTITWDTKKLEAIAQQFHADEAAEIFKVKLEIPEDAFEVLREMDHPAIGSIILARTVKDSDVSAKPV